MMSKFLSVAGHPAERQADGKMEDWKEVTTRYHFKWRQNSKQVFLDDVAHAFQPKHTIQELDIEFRFQ